MMVERKKVIGIAAGGHSRVMLEALALVGSTEVVGLLDSRRELWGKMVGGVPVLGGDDLLPDMLSKGIDRAFIGLGSTQDVRPRSRLYGRVRDLGFEIIAVIDPRAMVSTSATIGYAPTVLAGTIIGPGVRIGDDVIVNNGAIVEHDCSLGNHIHIATGARLASAVVVEDEVHIGVGAVVRQCVTIHRGAVIGAGAVVIADVPPNVIAVGVPARVLRKVAE